MTIAATSRTIPAEFREKAQVLLDEGKIEKADVGPYAYMMWRQTLPRRTEMCIECGRGYSWPPAE